MKKKIAYIAYDGTEFDTRRECENYESMFEVSDDDISLFDASMNKLSLKPTLVPQCSGVSTSYILSRIDKTLYIRIKTPKGLNNCIKLLHHEGISTQGIVPQRSQDMGFYYYCDKTDEWINIGEKITFLQNMIDKMLSAEEDPK